MSCAFEGDCDRPVRAKGLCYPHYRQQLRGRPLTPIGGRGFGGMVPEARRAIAVQGGRAAHRKGTAHRWTPEEAQVAARLGGLASARARRAKAVPESNQCAES